MTLKTKSRVTKVTQRSGLLTTDWTPSNNGFFETPWSWTYRNRQVTRSEGHAWPKDRGVRDAGGDFDTIRLTFKTTAREGPYFAGPRSDVLGSSYYSGDMTSSNSRAAPREFREELSDDEYFAFCQSSSEEQLMAVGSEFVARSIPTNPTLSASVAVAELYREGIPNLLGSAFLRDRSSFFRSLGSEYLNIEFGWKPLVSDLKAAASAVLKSNSILEQLARDSGRDVHRRRYSPVQRWVEDPYDSWVPDPSGIPNQYFSTPSRHREIHSFERSNWFSGCFTYHYEPSHMSEVQRIATQARLLYGLELTPEVLWNLAPWSWLVDWVSNVGPVLHNLSAFQNDQLVMRYGYVMEYNSRNTQYFAERGEIPYGTDLPKHCTESFQGIRKLRRKATPYGFGVDIAGFSTRQWAILAALGITRAPRTL